MHPETGWILQRRSVRRYLDKDVTDETVHELIEAAMAAPSACARDPWHFVVVRDKARLGHIADGLPNGKMLADAAVGIVVVGSPKEAHDGQESYMLQDCSAAIENLLLAATSLGLGACWLGVHPRQDRINHLRITLKLPADVTPISVIAVGWPAESPAPRTRFTPDKVHTETW